MASLSFFGAVGSVTGSRFLLEVDNQKILVDCGLFQGPKKNRLRNWERFPIAPKSIDRILLTHAHIDHAGYIPRLVKQGFKGPINCTRPTADLCRIMLLDSAHIQEEDAEWANKKGFTKHKPALPLFSTRDAERALSLFEPLHYGEQLNLNDEIRVKFKDAGHLLGSAFIDIRAKRGKKMRKIVFSGDMGRPGRALLRDPVQVYDIDYLVLESTYGKRLHKDASFRNEFIRVINESVERGGVLMIPSFAVGRTQTLMYILRQLEEEGVIPSLPVYVDSPMALEALKVYEKRIKDQNLACRTQTIKGKRVFRPGQVHLTGTRKKSQAIADVKSSAIIIASSGMVTAGRILHHFTQRLADKRNTVLFVGYQAEGTRGRAMVEGEPTVKIHGRHIDVNAHMENLTGLSGHADYHEIMAWLTGLNHGPERIFIVHGEQTSSQSLAEKITSHFSWDVTVPELNDTVELDL